MSLILYCSPEDPRKDEIEEMAQPIALKFVSATIDEPQIYCMNTGFKAIGVDKIRDYFQLVRKAYNKIEAEDEGIIQKFISKWRR